MSHFKNYIIFLLSLLILDIKTSDWTPVSLIEHMANSSIQENKKSLYYGPDNLLSSTNRKNLEGYLTTMESDFHFYVIALESINSNYTLDEFSEEFITKFKSNFSITFTNQFYIITTTNDDKMSFTVENMDSEKKKEIMSYYETENSKSYFSYYSRNGYYVALSCMVRNFYMKMTLPDEYTAETYAANITSQGSFLVYDPTNTFESSQKEILNEYCTEFRKWDTNLYIFVLNKYKSEYLDIKNFAYEVITNYSNKFLPDAKDLEKSVIIFYSVKLREYYVYRGSSLKDKISDSILEDINERNKYPSMLNIYTGVQYLVYKIRYEIATSKYGWTAKMIYDHINSYQKDDSYYIYPNIELTSDQDEYLYRYPEDIYDLKKIKSYSYNIPKIHISYNGTEDFFNDLVSMSSTRFPLDMNFMINIIVNSSETHKNIYRCHISEKFSNYTKDLPDKINSLINDKELDFETYEKCLILMKNTFINYDDTKWTPKLLANYYEEGYKDKYYKYLDLTREVDDKFDETINEYLVDLANNNFYLYLFVIYKQNHSDYEIENFANLAMNNFTFLEKSKKLKSMWLVILLGKNSNYSFYIEKEVADLLSNSELDNIIKSEYDIYDRDKMILNSVKRLRRFIVLYKQKATPENIVNYYNDFLTNDSYVLYNIDNVRDLNSTFKYVLVNYIEDILEYNINFYLFSTVDNDIDRKEFIDYIVNYTNPNEQKINKDNIIYSVVFYKSDNSSENNFEFVFGANHKDLMNETQYNEFIDKVREQAVINLLGATKLALKYLRQYSLIKNSTDDIWTPVKFYNYYLSKYQQNDIFDMYCYLNQQNISSFESNIRSFLGDKNIKVYIHIINKFENKYNADTFLDELISLFYNKTCNEANEEKYTFIFISVEDNQIAIKTNVNYLLTDGKIKSITSTLSLYLKEQEVYLLINSIISELSSVFYLPESWDTKTLINYVVKYKEKGQFLFYNKYKYVYAYNDTSKIQSYLGSFDKIQFTYFIVINKLVESYQKNITSFTITLIEEMKKEELLDENTLLIIFVEEDDLYIISNTTDAGKKISSSKITAFQKYMDEHQYTSIYEKYAYLLELIQGDLKSEVPESKLKIILIVVITCLVIIIGLILFFVLFFPAIKERCKDKVGDYAENEPLSHSSRNTSRNTLELNEQSE